MRYTAAVLLLGGLLLGTASPLHAQDERQFGLTLGVNWASLQSPSEDPGRFFAFAGGLGVHQPLAGPVALQSELLISQKGGEISGAEGARIKYSAGYLELPALLHLEAPSVRSITAYAEAGGFGAVKLFERQGAGGTISVDTGLSFFHRFNAGPLAGVGATFPIGGQTLNLTVRRAWGLPDVVRNVESEVFEGAELPPEGRTRTWSLLLRFGF